MLPSVKRATAGIAIVFKLLAILGKLSEYLPEKGFDGINCCTEVLIGRIDM
jgi:hypothetical protein